MNPDNVISFLDWVTTKGRNRFGYFAQGMGEQHIHLGQDRVTEDDWRRWVTYWMEETGRAEGSVNLASLIQAAANKIAEKGYYPPSS